MSGRWTLKLPETAVTSRASREDCWANLRQRAGRRSKRAKESLGLQYDVVSGAKWKVANKGSKILLLHNILPKGEE